MRHIRRLFTRRLVAAVTCAVAADMRPGDQARLVEWDQHIPAGDTRVHLRSVSGSAATVLRVDAATG
jgi:hypothetical protein